MLKVVKKDVLPIHSHTGKPQILANHKNYKCGKILQKKKMDTQTFRALLKCVHTKWYKGGGTCSAGPNCRKRTFSCPIGSRGPQSRLLVGLRHFVSSSGLIAASARPAGPPRCSDVRQGVHVGPEKRRLG